MLMRLHDTIYSDFLDRTISFNTFSSYETADDISCKECIIVFADGRKGAGYDNKLEKLILVDDSYLAKLAGCHIAIPVLHNDHDELERSQFIVEIGARRKYKKLYIVNIDINNIEEARKKIIDARSKVSDPKLKIADSQKEGELSNKDILQCFFAQNGSKDVFFRDIGYEQSKFNQLAGYKLKRDAVIMLGLTMKLDVYEADYFLMVSGFAFGNNDRDKIIKECISQRKYDLKFVNDMLYKAAIHRKLEIRDKSQKNDTQKGD